MRRARTKSGNGLVTGERAMTLWSDFLSRVMLSARLGGGADGAAARATGAADATDPPAGPEGSWPEPEAAGAVPAAAAAVAQDGR
jgi:hypothetical protein